MKHLQLLFFTSLSQNTDWKFVSQGVVLFFNFFANKQLTRKKILCFFCKSVNICKKNFFLIFANFSVFIFKICKTKKNSVEGGKISAYTTYFFVHALLLQFINNIQSTGLRKKYSIPKKNNNNSHNLPMQNIYYVDLHTCSTE